MAFDILMRWVPDKIAFEDLGQCLNGCDSDEAPLELIMRWLNCGGAVAFLLLFLFLWLVQCRVAQTVRIGSVHTGPWCYHSPLQRQPGRTAFDLVVVELPVHLASLLMVEVDVSLGTASKQVACRLCRACAQFGLGRH